MINHYWSPSTTLRNNEQMIVERWANGAGKEEGYEVEVEVEERGFLLDPHMWCVVRLLLWDCVCARKKRLSRPKSDILSTFLKSIKLLQGRDLQKGHRARP